MPRRRYQMPDVERRKSAVRDYWRVRWWEDVLEGGQVVRKRRSKFLGYCHEVTRKQALRLRTALMEEVNLPSRVVKAQITVAEFSRIWLKTHVPTLGEAVQQHYPYQVRNHIIPDMGGLQLQQVTTEVVQSWLNSKAGMAWSTRADLRAILSGMFTKARDWGYWTGSNPVERTTPGRRRDKWERRLLTEEEIARLIAALPPLLALLVRLLRATGLRVSEALGLEWRHVNLATGWVIVEQRWYRGSIDVVKTGAGNREVPLGAALTAELRGLKAEGFIFDDHGQPPDDRILRNTLRETAKSLGLYWKGCGFHVFRREFASRIQAAGASAVEAGLMLGHSRPAVTQRYTLPARQRLQEVAERMQSGGTPSREDKSA